MPNPQKGETERDFLKRCIPELIKDEGYGRNQAVAICYSKYRKSGTKLNPNKKHIMNLIY